MTDYNQAIDLIVCASFCAFYAFENLVQTDYSEEIHFIFLGILRWSSKNQITPKIYTIQQMSKQMKKNTKCDLCLKKCMLNFYRSYDYLYYFLKIIKLIFIRCLMRSIMVCL